MTAILYRYFGFIDLERTGLRFRWLEVSWNRMGFALGLHRWGEPSHWSLHVHLLWLNVFLRLPFAAREHDGEMSDQWGFSFWGDDRGQFFNALHLHWHARTKVVYMPWDWTFHGHEVLTADGQWIPAADTMWDWTLRAPVGYGRHSAEPDGRKFELLPYHYRLRNGQVQNVMAAVSVDRREWRWRALKSLPWPAKRRTTINVDFDGEVGERAGSWKGGTTGCGYELKSDETPKQCLRRMERERAFT